MSEEWVSPTKSLHNIFKASSHSSSESLSPSRKLKFKSRSQNSSPSRTDKAKGLLSRFSRSSNENILSIRHLGPAYEVPHSIADKDKNFLLIQNLSHGQDNTSLKDFADTSDEDQKSQAEIDADSIDSVFNIYRDKQIDFIFKEDLNDINQMPEGRTMQQQDKIDQDTTTFLNDILESLNINLVRNTVISLSSGELLNRIGNSSLHDLSEKSTNDPTNISEHPIVIHKFKEPQSPRLIEVDKDHIIFEPIKSLDSVHYHDSDISSNNSNYSHEISIPTLRHSEKSPFIPNKSKPPVNVPPHVPTHDITIKQKIHEQMHQTKSPSTSGPKEAFEVKSDFSFYDQLSEESFVAPKSFSWRYFSVMMMVGLLIPPVYFLLSLGIFDRLGTAQHFYSGIYYKKQYLINRNKLVKFSTVQKSVSFIIGIFWFGVILAMIGVGLGISQ